MDFLNYLSKHNAQKKIDSAAKKYKGKKIAIYGAGNFSKVIFDNFDLSKLNIVAVADLKFEAEENRNFYNYNCIPPNDLKEFDCDVILISNYEFMFFWNYLEKNLLDGTKNEDIKIRPLVELSLFEYFKELFFTKSKK
jgi:hypothetical protein